VALCEILEWDSAFFGRSIARYRGAGCVDVRVLCAECAQRGIDCVYILVDSCDTRSVAALNRAGVLLTDVRLTFERRIAESATPQRCGLPVRPATPSDLPTLKRLASVSHHLTRFYADPHFPAGQCDRLYETWIERSCDGYADDVLVAQNGGAPVGYVTCHHEPDGRGRIGLFAVDGSHQGRGVGGALLAAAAASFTAHGVSTMTVATQLRNTRAVRLYERTGFAMRRADLWFHYWPASARETSRS